MADYYFPTVVNPTIPPLDMSPLEHFLLSRIFEEETDDGASYFYSSCGPNDALSVEAEPLRAALLGSRNTPSPIEALVARAIENRDAEGADGSDDIDLDLTEMGVGWPEMLQAIVRRSHTIDEIVVTSAYTCSKMRPDGFGGSVTRITDAAIQYASTYDMLARMQGETNLKVTLTEQGHETRSSLEEIAGKAGWNSFTLLHLIVAWLDRNGHSEALVAVLAGLAKDEDAQPPTTRT